MNLTGPTQWRFDLGPWIEFESDSMLWNEPYKAHATRVGDVPFVSIYSWCHSVNEQCSVVPAKDWDQYDILPE